jgi:hypothetical protein
MFQPLTPQPLSPGPPPAPPGREGLKTFFDKLQLTSPSSPRQGWEEGWEKRAGVMRAYPSFRNPASSGNRDRA